MKLQKRLIIKFFFVIFVFTKNGYTENNFVSSFSEIDKILKIGEFSEIIINKPLILNENKKYNESVTFNFVDNGMIVIPNEKKLFISGKIKSKKKIFQFENKENYKNLFLNSETFDVRWFDDLNLSQKYSSYHGKKMYFDNYTIEGGIGFKFSNIKAHFNNTLITGTFHFSEMDDCSNEKILKNISIEGTVNINGRFGGYCGKNIFVNEVKIISSQKFRAGGVHIYSNIKNLKINNLYIEDSIRHNALGIDSDSLDSMPENIYIDKVYIKNSFVHGAFINGINISIGELFINDFGNLRKSNFINSLHRGLNFPFYFKYLDLFENSPKGLIIGYGSNIKIDDVVIKTNNYSLLDFLNYFRIKKFLIQPSLFFVDLTNEAKIGKIDIEMPTSIKFTNKVINFMKNKILIKLLNKPDQNKYRINYNYTNIWPFEFYQRK